jgi:hypothetical protein
MGREKSMKEALGLEGNATPPKLDLRPALLSAAELLGLEIPERPKILGEWLREGDFGYLYAPRGHGKTWMALLTGSAISKGEELGLWEKGLVPRRVVYLDAEMNLPDVKARAALTGIESKNFVWLHHERILALINRTLNIANTSDQEAICDLLNDGDLLVIDNLSTAASGMGENDNDDFDMIKPWLLKMRSRRITVIIIHHAGRNGDMRGASRREDIAHWIISLKDATGEGHSTRWVTHFKKCRNCPSMEAPPLRWTITEKDGKLEVGCEKYSGPEAMLGLIRDGVGGATELSGELGVTTGCVSKWAKKLIQQGLIKKSGRDYVEA